MTAHVETDEVSVLPGGGVGDGNGLEYPASFAEPAAIWCPMKARKPAAINRLKGVPSPKHRARLSDDTLVALWAAAGVAILVAGLWFFSYLAT